MKYKCARGIVERAAVQRSVDHPNDHAAGYGGRAVTVRWDQVGQVRNANGSRYSP